MKADTLKSDALLLLAAVIWGLAFVAQRVGMAYVGPFIFNGVRFALGSLVLIPLIWRQQNRQNSSDPNGASAASRTLILGGILAGLAVFGGASFQQIGLVYTTAGNAGFITGLYVVISRDNLVKKIIGLNIFQVSVIMFYVAMGKVRGGTAPIEAEGFTVFSNPLPHVLMLTAIVVGVATTALALSLVVRINEAYDTIEEDELRELEREEEA